MPIKKEIKFPIFLECCQYTTDIFWETIFEDLAYGQPPNGTYINKGFLCCSYKNKDFNYKIDNKKADKMYKDIIKLLSSKLNILSYQERIEKRKRFHLVETSIKESHREWSDIKKKNIKDLLIEKYVLDMKKKHSLTFDQTRYLLSLIFITIVFKIITPKDIVYEKGKIVTIKGIDFEKKCIHLKRDIYELEADFSPRIILDKQKMSDSWEKYLKDLRKISER
jgi:hypothetical protein